MFLKRSVNQEEPDTSEDLEEQYLRLFPKIGRDFVYREDFEDAMANLIQYINPLLITLVNFRSDARARLRAREYKDQLSTGDVKNKYKDLINLDE